ncbi:hypothetical protein LOZ58_003659 [Ophidiomyces ophidiicola]|nr:hypothetical protein LOZ58_003659 [Ophidiomyces ophidiicola]
MQSRESSYSRRLAEIYRGHCRYAPRRQIAIAALVQCCRQVVRQRLPNVSFHFPNIRHYSSEEAKNTNDTLTDEQTIYLAYRPFTQHNGKFFSRKTAASLKHFVVTHTKPAQAVVDRVGVLGVVRILKSLVDKEIFASEEKAKKEFPTLFGLPPADCAAPPPSDTSALDVDNIPPEDGTEEEKTETSQSEESNGETVLSRRKYSAVNYRVFDSASPVTIPGTETLSLHPTYLPYRTQHLILCRVQSILEHTCFEFASKWAPQLMGHRGWECPEALELSRWVGNLYPYFERFPDNVWDSTYKPHINSIFGSLIGLRNAAVHRHHVSLRAMDEMIRNSILLMGMLRDHAAEYKLTALHLELKKVTKSQNTHVDFLERQYLEELSEIRRLREELRQREQKAFDVMMQGSKTVRDQLGSELEMSFEALLSKDMEIGEQDYSLRDIGGASQTSEDPSVSTPEPPVSMDDFLSAKAAVEEPSCEIESEQCDPESKASIAPSSPIEESDLKKQEDLTLATPENRADNISEKIDATLVLLESQPTEESTNKESIEPTPDEASDRKNTPKVACNIL